jgi:hypothetical protein
MLHGVLMNSWDPVLGAAWQQLAGPACGPTQAARAAALNIDFRRSRPPIAFVYAFPIFKTAQAAQSKFGKLVASSCNSCELKTKKNRQRLP